MTSDTDDVGGITADVAWPGRVSSLLAPVLLIGGWTLAASLQPGRFDSGVRTISELAALDAASRWVMTLAIAGTGVCHMVTSLSLRPASRAGRVLLGLGGLASLGVASFPLPAGGGGSSTHTVVAFLAFVLLTLWAPFAGRRGVDAPWGLRRPVALVAGSVLGALTLWFFVALLTGSTGVGLTERLAAGAQALWPAVVVVSVPRRRGSPLNG
jgi:hypothetical membrane protein